MTDPLVAFLKARLDEGEAAVANPETWIVGPEAQGTRRIDVMGSFERVVACTRTWRAEHIVRHDPKRVLADIAAKRLLIKEYEGEAWVSKQQGHKSGWTEGGLSARRTLLEAFAKVYDDHPDYRDKWTDSEQPWAD